MSASTSSSSSSSLPSVVIYRNNVRISERVAAVILAEYHKFQLVGCDTNEITKDVLPSSIQLAIVFGSCFSVEDIKAVAEKSAAVEIYGFAGSLDKYRNVSFHVILVEFREGESEVSDRIIKLYAPLFVPFDSDVKVFLNCMHQKALGGFMERSAKAVIEFLYTHDVDDAYLRSAITGAFAVHSIAEQGQHYVTKTQSLGKGLASKAGHYHCFGYNVRIVDSTLLVEAATNAMCKDGADIAIISRFDHLSKKYRYTMQTQRNDIDLLSFRTKYGFDCGGCSKQIGFLHELDPRSFIEKFKTDKPVKCEGIASK